MHQYNNKDSGGEMKTATTTRERRQDVTIITKDTFHICLCIYATLTSTPLNELVQSTIRTFIQRAVWVPIPAKKGKSKRATYVLTFDLRSGIDELSRESGYSVTQIINTAIFLFIQNEMKVDPFSDDRRSLFEKWQSLNKSE